MDEILDVILIKEDNYLMRLCLCLSFLPTCAGLPLGAEVDCLHLLYKNSCSENLQTSLLMK